MNTDLHTLTGAYAVDALTDEERRPFERHLETCEPCRQEVQELQATAAQLGAAVHAEPPAGLKADVMARIEQEPQEREVVTMTRATPPSAPVVSELPTRWYTRLMAPAAAAVLIAVLGLTAIIANLNDRIDELEVASTRVADIVAAEGARIVEVSGPDGSSAKIVLAAGRGEAVFLASGLPELPPGKAYELWLIGEQIVPAGVFVPGERGRVSQVMTGDMRAVEAIGVTVEPESGSPQPTSEPIMVAELTTEA